VRAVNIWTANGRTNRAITRLYPLEIRASITPPEQGKNDSTDCDDDSPDVVDLDNTADRP